MNDATLHFDLHQPVTFANFALTGGTKAHPLVKMPSTIITFDNLQPHTFGAF
jgi:hypothetical protein